MRMACLLVLHALCLVFPLGEDSCRVPAFSPSAYLTKGLEGSNIIKQSLLAHIKREVINGTRKRIKKFSLKGSEVRRCFVCGV